MEDHPRFLPPAVRENLAFEGESPAILVPYVRSYRLADRNGDGDGFPDPNETLDLTLVLRNPALGVLLTNVVVEALLADPKVDCVQPQAQALPTLAPGTEVALPLPFELHIHPLAERAGAGVSCNSPGPNGACSNFAKVPGGCTVAADCFRTALQDYSAVLELRISANELAVPVVREVAFDLDLDSAHPPQATTTWSEGFESPTPNPFVLENLDANRASNSASDGYRCQYTDPDFPNSHAYGNTECYLGFDFGQSPVNAWHRHSLSAPDGGRAFLGTRSLHYGVHPNPGSPAMDTLQLAQLDGARIAATVALAAGICRDDASPNPRACRATADCSVVGGGPCVAANPVLSFAHQVSIVDDRGDPRLRAGLTIDRAVVHAQVVGSSVWVKLDPFENVHNSRGQNAYGYCSFDPIDDGNDEDDYFDPTDPRRLYGPSSTCFPAFVFSNLGDTDQAYDPSRIGEASDGPGVAGSVGQGTWVVSRFDLSRFRGRSIQLRFLFTNFKLADDKTYEDVLHWNPTGLDDGWYVDDVRVTSALGAGAPSVTIDSADNSGLSPGNTDLDERGDDCDCAPLDPGAFALPGEVGGLKFIDDDTLTWTSVRPSAGSGSVHDLLRGTLDELPVGSGFAEVCNPGLSDDVVTVADDPAAGEGFWYLVRGRNSCGNGGYGHSSDGTPRTSNACP